MVLHPADKMWIFFFSRMNCWLHPQIDTSNTCGSVCQEDSLKALQFRSHSALKWKRRDLLYLINCGKHCWPKDNRITKIKVGMGIMIHMCWTKLIQYTANKIPVFYNVPGDDPSLLADLIGYHWPLSQQMRYLYRYRLLGYCSCTFLLFFHYYFSTV